ncbi:MAG: spore cortex biosynthesis protein YabQ [Oscillospiraceae bacterium]|nr:spore cortex biosynthesis protein YabQ [Oscillospiraceae bacterium]
MALTVWEQGAQFLSTLVLGMVLGLSYDFFRGLRHAFPKCGCLADGLWSIFALLSCNLFTLYVGKGAFLLFLFPGAGIGFFLYRKTLGRVLLPLWLGILKKIRAIGAFFLHFLAKNLKIIKKFSIYIFSFFQKWYTITVRKRRGRTKKHKGGSSHEKVQTFPACEIDRPGGSGVRHIYPGGHEQTTFCAEGRSRRSHRPHRSDRGGKRPVAGRY